MAIIKSAGITDVGRIRKNNEDVLYYNDLLKLYIVSDGMGGHKAGEVASGLVVDMLQSHMNKIVIDGKDLKPEVIDDSLSITANHIIAEINAANRNLYQLSSTNNSCKGMGATVSLVFFTDKSLIAANVGDSPIYLIHNNNIELLSVIHNLKTELNSIEHSDKKQKNSKFSHVLTRAMGINKIVKADICEIPYFRGDIVVICSDGLSDLVEPDKIRDIVCSMGSESACKALVDLANERGGKDNITIIVIKIKKTITSIIDFFLKAFNK